MFSIEVIIGGFELGGEWLQGACTYCSFLLNRGGCANTASVEPFFFVLIVFGEMTGWGKSGGKGGGE
jgi:hypothetical protein